MRVLTGKARTFRKESRSGEVRSEHGILSLEEGDHWFDRGEVGVFKRKKLLNLSTP